MLQSVSKSSFIKFPRKSSSIWNIRRSDAIIFQEVQAEDISNGKTHISIIRLNNSSVAIKLLLEVQSGKTNSIAITASESVNDFRGASLFRHNEPDSQYVSDPIVPSRTSFNPDTRTFYPQDLILSLVRRVMLLRSIINRVLKTYTGISKLPRNNKDFFVLIQISIYLYYLYLLKIS